MWIPGRNPFRFTSHRDADIVNSAVEGIEYAAAVLPEFREPSGCLIAFPAAVAQRGGDAVCR